MLRTQIYLPDELHSQLASWARREAIPMAELVRKILKRGLKKREEFLEEGNDLLELGRLKIHGGPKDLSSKFDSYLYESNENIS